VSHIVVRGGHEIPQSELRWRFSRSSGPGGQGVNTTDSRVELLWDLGASEALPPALKERALSRLANRLVDGVLSVTVSDERAQMRNRQIAEHRLASIVSDAIAPPPAARRATRPTRGSVERRLTSKRKASQIKRSRRGQWD